MKRVLVYNSKAASFKKIEQREILNELPYVLDETFNLANQPRNILQEKLLEFLKTAKGNDSLYILVIGGDGTIHLVANTLMMLNMNLRNEIILASIAGGSSNDYHKPYQSHLSKVPCAINERSSILADLGEVTIDGKTHYFVSNLGGGATALGNYYFNYPDPILGLLQKVSVGLAIVFAVLKSLVLFKAHPGSVNHQRIEQLVNYAVLKNNYFTGSLSYPSRPYVDDGKFSFYAVHGISKLRSIKSLIDLSKGELDLPDSNMTYIEDEVLDLQFDKKVPVELDGEVYLGQNISIRIIPRAIRRCLV
jgi:diacylglycerol kinase family enzyme